MLALSSGARRMTMNGGKLRLVGRARIAMLVTGAGFAALLGLFADSSATAPPPRAKDQVLVIQQVITPTLEPAFFSLYHNYTLIDNLFDTLVKRDTRGRLVPGLASSWSAAGRVWTFKLRRDARFSDGTPITATDVRYSLIRALTPITNETMQRLGVTTTFPQGLIVTPDILGAAAIRAGSATSLPRNAITAPDRYRVRITLEAARADFPDRMAYPAFGVVKASNVASGGAGSPWWYKPVSSGPFAVQSFVPNTSVTLVRNRYYRPKPILQRVEFKVVTNTQTAEIAYQAGDLDVVRTVYSDVLNLESRGLHSQMRARQDVTVSNFIVNPTIPPTDDLHVARAIWMAIDRQALTRRILDGLVQPATTFTPPGLVPGYTAKGYTPLAFNPAAARAELARSKYGTGITLRAWASASQDPRSIQAIAQMLEQNLGVDVTIRTTLSPAQAPKDQAVNLNFSAQGATFLAPCSMVQRWPDFITFANGANNVNFGALTAPGLEAAMKACYSANPANVWRRVMAVESILKQYPQFIPVHYNRSFYLVKPKVRNLALGNSWNIANLDQVWIAAD